MDDKIIYKSSDISVTTSKVIIRGTTYLVKDIAGVAAVRFPNVASIALLILGLLVGVAGIANFKDAWFLLLASAAMVFGAIKWKLSFYRVRLETPSGSVDVYKGEKFAMVALKATIEKAKAEAAMARGTQLA